MCPSPAEASRGSAENYGPVPLLSSTPQWPRAAAASLRNAPPACHAELPWHPSTPTGKGGQKRVGQGKDMLLLDTTLLVYKCTYTYVYCTEKVYKFRSRLLYAHVHTHNTHIHTISGSRPLHLGGRYTLSTSILVYIQYVPVVH